MEQAVATDSTPKRPPERETLRGLVSGKIPMRTALKPCWIVGRALPSWLFAVEALGFQTAHVSVLDTGWVPRLRELVGSVSASLDIPPVAVGDTAFCCGRLSEGVFRGFQAAGITRIFCTSGIRWKHGDGWMFERILVDHTSIGGVTTGSDHVYMAWNPDVWKVIADIPAVPCGVLRDASTIISTTERCVRPIAVDRMVVEPIALVNLGTAARPVYHSGGLLPANPDAGLWVATMSCFTPNRWGVRQVTTRELLEAYDVPGPWLGPLTVYDDISWSDLTPTSVLVAGASQLLQACLNGGEKGMGSLRSQKKGMGSLRSHLSRIRIRRCSRQRQRPAS